MKAAADLTSQKPRQLNHVDWNERDGCVATIINQSKTNLSIEHVLFSILIRLPPLSRLCPWTTIEIILEQFGWNRVRWELLCVRDISDQTLSWEEMT